MGKKRKAVLSLNVKHHLEDLKHRWQGTEKCLKAARQGVDWINLAQHRNKWRALVHTAMNLSVPSTVRNISFEEVFNFSQGVS